MSVTGAIAYVGIYVAALVAAAAIFLLLRTVKLI